jgi:hypothetical protein
MACDGVCAVKAGSRRCYLLALPCLVTSYARGKHGSLLAPVPALGRVRLQALRYDRLGHSLQMDCARMSSAAEQYAVHMHAILQDYGCRQREIHYHHRRSYE